MQTLLAIMQIFPALLGVITAVEQAFPQAGVGSQKLDMVKQIMLEAYDGIQEIMPAIEKIVGVVVAFANAIGAFRKDG
jgi:hypothetical protein